MINSAGRRVADGLVGPPSVAPVDRYVGSRLSDRYRGRFVGLGGYLRVFNGMRTSGRPAMRQAVYHDHRFNI